MNTYAVNYRYAASNHELAELRPAHRAWLEGLLGQGTLLASGPLGDFAGALLIMKATDESELSSILDNDPFDIAGFIGERVIEEWKPVFGPFN
ncbi:MAG: YciI family protein [Micrococcales bacterium]